MSKSLPEISYMGFDEVGLLIASAETGHEIHGERATLSLYREAHRYSDDDDLFPDDLLRAYLASGTELGLPAGGPLRERRHAHKGCDGTIEPAEFTAPDHFTSMAAPRRPWPLRAPDF
ncbi:UNVERIFIED_ORG: putative hydrolase of the HAD superfamily [Rhizobium pisi]